MGTGTGSVSTIRGAQVDILTTCIESLKQKSTNTNYEILIMHNNELRQTTRGTASRQGGRLVPLSKNPNATP